MLKKPFQKVAAHAFIKKGRKFLVTLRSPENDYKPNEWDLPGGTIEFGEEPKEALLREISEETGLKVVANNPIYICSAVGGERHQFWIVFDCKYCSGKVRLNPEEHSDYKWVDKKELKKINKIFFLQKFFEDVLSK